MSAERGRVTVHSALGDLGGVKSGGIRQLRANQVAEEETPPAAIFSSAVPRAALSVAQELDLVRSPVTLAAGSASA